jgi:hypothetical protein
VTDGLKNPRVHDSIASQPTCKATFPIQDLRRLRSRKARPSAQLQLAGPPPRRWVTGIRQEGRRRSRASYLNDY